MSNAADKSPLIGKVMIIAAWLLLLALLTLFFNDRLDHQRNPNRNLNAASETDTPSVQLQRNRFGHYVATGATDVSIPVAVADKLKLKRGQPAVYQTANGPITAWRTTLDEVQLGPLRVGPVTASINPADSTGAILLGMSFLRQLDFSQQGNTLTLKYPQSGAY